MKNKIERNNAISSKNGYPQFIIVFGLILLLAFFAAGGAKAQCLGKNLSTSTTPIHCAGQIGGVWVNFIGGTSPYTYNWSNGKSGVRPVNGDSLSVHANTYTVTVTDGSGCTLITAISLTEPPQLTVTSVTTPVSCKGGNNGTVSVTAAGGVGGYSYLWSPSGNTTSTITGLTMGLYVVTVTDGNGCTQTTAKVVTEPSAITAQAASTPVKCNGGNDGTASATATGGVGGYSYSWSPSGKTTSIITSLTMGTYTVSVEDGYGCTATSSTTVTEPPLLIGNATVTKNVSCHGGNDGLITLSASGGTSPYTYSWFTGTVGTTLSCFATTIGSCKAQPYH